MFVALIVLCPLASAAEFSGKVIAVLDGDTLLVLRDGHPVKVRFAEIDAPEKAQPFGMASKKSLSEMVKGKQIKVVSRAVDDYGRLVAMVYVGELNVNHEQVRRGMAWEYSRFHSNRELMALQHEAQQARRGLWAGTDPVEPSQWRKQHPGTWAAPLPASVPSTPAPSSPAPTDQACGKKHCSEMNSCEDAMHYFSICGQKALDGDADGKPCEKLCADAGKL
ncbi:MAG: thermonuclease family protein [Nitrosomonadales bacterium]|nr:thermonuclease family protein [Nitrosomonadales bacterium]